ncbi:MAG: bifunctional ADP-dependent NAD(P)H-hydrate dehydratase/NAD(P)H-hydrate epimerase [Raineya sp.]
MKLLSSEQLQYLDRATIEQKPIASISLMEKAATKCVEWLIANFSGENFVVFAGKGNNGGDGLAIARLLFQRGQEVKVYIVENSSRFSPDCQSNLSNLPKDITVSYLNETQYIPENLPEKAILIDAIFGLGLSRALTQWIEKLLMWLNQQHSLRIAIDLPTGMLADTIQINSVIFCADYTLTFHKPKIAMLLPNAGNFAGKIIVLDIGLLAEVENTLESHYFLHTSAYIRQLYAKKQKRAIFSHKGTNGHALLVAGSYGKGGASVLAAKACMKSGVGLLSVIAPKCNYTTLQTSIPEAMLLPTEEEAYITTFQFSQNFQAVGVGCGIGLHPNTQSMLKFLIQNTNKNLVLDADALNILAENPTWLAFLPPHSILTPHPKEFARLVGTWQNEEECMDKMKDFAYRYNCFLLLKGAFSRISTPEGKIFFNTTGNPAMASAGMGDVLTGIITALLARGYSPYEALSIGVFVHGLAADLLVEQTKSPFLVASDIISYLGKAFGKL